MTATAFSSLLRWLRPPVPQAATAEARAYPPIATPPSLRFENVGPADRARVLAQEHRSHRAAEPMHVFHLGF